MEYHIGKLIKSIRKERKLPGWKVTRGLTGVEKISRMETGGQELGKWMSDALLERLGVSANKFGCLFLDEELESYELRRELLAQLTAGEWEKAARTYKKFYQQIEIEKEAEAGVKVFQEQFLRFINLLAYYDEDMRTCFAKISADNGQFYPLLEISPDVWERNIKEALELTVPDFIPGQTKEYLLSRIERALVVMLADMLTAQKEKQEAGLELFRQVLWSMEELLVDEEELGYQYPRVAALAVRCFAAYGNYHETWVSDKGKEILLRNRMVNELDTFLRYELEEAVLSHQEERRQNISLELKLLEELHIGYSSDNIEKEWSGQKLSVFLELAESSVCGIALGARIKRARQEKGLTQKELADGICSERSISRLEQGKGRPHPYIIQNLLNRLGQGTKRYFSEIVSNDYRTHECRRQMTASMAVMDYKQAEKMLNALEYSLDKEEVINRQALLAYHTVIDSEFGYISAEKEEKQYWAALSMSVPEDIQVEYWPLKKAETVLLNNIANAMEKMDRVNEAMLLLKKVIESCERYHLMAEGNNPQYMLTLYNLSRYVGNLGYYEEALEQSKKGLELALQVGDGEAIVEFLYKTAWNQEQIYESEGTPELKETCLTMCRQAYELAKLINYRVLEKHIIKHCREIYDVEL